MLTNVVQQQKGGGTMAGMIRRRGLSTHPLSGLQKEVISLYRSILRAAHKKDAMGESGTVTFARSQFRREASSVKRTDFQKIEFMIRKGHKQLRLLNMPGVRGARGVEVQHQQGAPS